MSLLQYQCFRQRISRILFVSLYFSTLAFAAEPKKKDPLPEITTETKIQPKLPTLKEVMNIAQVHFSGLKHYQSGDLITRNKTKPIFSQPQKAGWTVKSEKIILSRLHSETDFLAAQLRTDKGRKFPGCQAVMIAWTVSRRCLTENGESRNSSILPAVI